MINKSTKEDIVEAVKNIELDTIYFLSKQGGHNGKDSQRIIKRRIIL